MGLSLVLVFVGVKMLAVDLYEVPVGVSLAVIATVLAVSVAASLVWPSSAAAPFVAAGDSGDRQQRRASSG